MTYMYLLYDYTTYYTTYYTTWPVGVKHLENAIILLENIKHCLKEIVSEKYIKLNMIYMLSTIQYKLNRGRL